MLVWTNLRKNVIVDLCSRNKEGYMKKEELIRELKCFIQDHGEHSTLADLPDDPSGDISLLTAVLKYCPFRDQNPEVKKKILLREIVDDLIKKRCKDCCK